MLVKELKKQLAKDNIEFIAFGKPLNQPTIPFTFLPKCLRGKLGKEFEKQLMNCEVLDYKIIGLTKLNRFEVYVYIK